LLQRQDVAELRRAIRRAAAEDLDRAAIAAGAQRFAADRFRRELRRIVREVVESVAA
jgi:Trm5-related predicted tRNA methylase